MLPCVPVRSAAGPEALPRSTQYFYCDLCQSVLPLGPSATISARGTILAFRRCFLLLIYPRISDFRNIHGCSADRELTIHRQNTALLAVISVWSVSRGRPTCMKCPPCNYCLTRNLSSKMHRPCNHRLVQRELCVRHNALLLPLIFPYCNTFQAINLDRSGPLFRHLILRKFG